MPQTLFPKLLSSQIAFDIARTILDGFDKHYGLFRASSQDAKRYFEQCDWKTAQTKARERIAFYDTRVQECVQVLEDEYDQDEIGDEVWREVKLHYIGLLVNHKQPELAETFSIPCAATCCTGPTITTISFSFGRRYRPSTSSRMKFCRPTVSTIRPRTDCDSL